MKGIHVERKLDGEEEGQTKTQCYGNIVITECVLSDQHGRCKQ